MAELNPKTPYNPDAFRSAIERERLQNTETRHIRALLDRAEGEIRDAVEARATIAAIWRSLLKASDMKSEDLTYNNFYCIFTRWCRDMGISIPGRTTKPKRAPAPEAARPPLTVRPAPQKPISPAAQRLQQNIS